MYNLLVVKGVTNGDLTIEVQIAECHRYCLRAFLVDARDAIRESRSTLLIHVEKLEVGIHISNEVV